MMPAEGDKPARIKMECLKCGKLFFSKGKFNRICPSCTHKNNTSRVRDVQSKIDVRSRGRNTNNY